ncbi:heterogeneous nuclear ribonucleoprotein 87f-related [Anaeramoeba flamelloides]|uniref:Heterogeneous nuclear ribonucleoprotein 87f-related n=1 Tax=Anaeramoeba flamelloides TaxID=1746091 RepID=A0AAV7Y8Z9_9EUKA|nr:heterogeneous nuclear ribonucleoprotein 87f-related [Anaeramoeba flamelloides]
MEKENQEKKNQNTKKQTDQVQPKKEKKETKKVANEKNENEQNTINKTQNNNQQEQIQQNPKENQQTEKTENKEPQTKLYIGNISFNSTEESLTKAFSKYGEIKSVNIVKRGERSLGYGFLEMSTTEEANLAIKELHQTMVDGREIIVEYADPNKAKRRKNPKYNYHYSKNYSRRKNFVPYREMIQPFPMFNIPYTDPLKYYEMMNYYQMGLTFYPQKNQLFYNYPNQRIPNYNYVHNQNSNEYYNYQQQRMDNNNLENENENENENEKKKQSNENTEKQKEIQNNNQTEKFEQQQQQQQQERFQYYQTQRRFNNFNPYYYNENIYSNQRRVFYPYKKNRYSKSEPKNFHKNSIFITNIPFSMTDQDLIEAFKELKPKNSRIVLNPYGKSRGFGFVEFENTANRDKALEFNETKLGGRIVYVKIAYGSSYNDEKNKN